MLILALLFLQVSCLKPAGPFGPFSPITVPFDLRIPVAVALFMVLISRRFVLKRLTYDRRYLEPVLGVWVGFSGLSFLWSSNRSETILQMVASLGACCFVGLLFVTADELSGAVLAWVACIAVTLSLCLLPIDFSFFAVNGRARGLFANPNGAALFSVFALYLRRFLPDKMRLFCLVSSLFLIALTQSRSGLLASGILLSVEFYLLANRTVRPLLLAIGFAFAVAVMMGSIPLLGSVRNENTRKVPWETGLRDLKSHFPLGTGSGAYDLEVSNSFLLQGIVMGLVGMLILAWLYIAFFFASKGDRHLTALSVAVLAHSQFEGWVLAGGSPFFVLLLLLYSSTPRVDRLEPPNQNPEIVLPLNFPKLRIE